MSTSIQNIQSQFQAAVSVFVAERDVSIAAINKIIDSEEVNSSELVEQIRLLTLAKLNIENTQEEVAKLINQYNEVINKTNHK